MARTVRPFARNMEKLRQEISGHRKELSGVDREVAGHQRAIAQAAAGRQYLNDLIQAKERMIARCAELGRAGPPAPRRRRPGRPPKAARPVRRVRRRRARRAPGPPEVRPSSQRFAALPVTDAAEQVLKTAGKPVHLKEIAAQIIAGGKAFRAKNPEASILILLRKDKRFRNTGKNMWTLA